MTLATLGYLFATFMSTKKSLTNYLGSITDILLKGTFIENSFDKWIKLTIFLGVIYFAGIIANATSYWVLFSNQADIIVKVNKCPPENTWNKKVLLTPIETIVCLQDQEDQGFPSYLEHIEQEAKWSNQNIDSLKYQLSSLIKYIRILRGAVFFSLCIFMIALAKILIAGLFCIVASIWLCVRKLPDWLCKAYNLIMYRENPLPSTLNTTPEEKTKAMRKDIFSNMLKPNVIILFLVGVIYCITMRGYYLVETEFDALAKYGSKYAAEETGKKKESKE